MKVPFPHFTKSEDGNAVIDWIVLMSGIVLLAISIVITITAPVAEMTDDTMHRAEQVDSVRPA